MQTQTKPNPRRHPYAFSYRVGTRWCVESCDHKGKKATFYVTTGSRADELVAAHIAAMKTARYA